MTLRKVAEVPEPFTLSLLQWVKVITTFPLAHYDIPTFEPRMSP